MRIKRQSLSAVSVYLRIHSMSLLEVASLRVEKVSQWKLKILLKFVWVKTLILISSVLFVTALGAKTCLTEMSLPVELMCTHLTLMGSHFAQCSNKSKRKLRYQIAIKLGKMAFATLFRKVLFS